MMGGGWLSRRRRRTKEEGDHHLVDSSSSSNGTPLPDDVLGAIFTRLSDAGDVLRCAATCRRWGRVVAEEAAVLASALPRGRGRGLAVGLFHQEDPGVAAPRKRKRTSSSDGASAARQPPRFCPTATAARLLGFDMNAPVFMTDGGHGALLEYSRPVASRSGRVVLELRRDGHADGVKLCVFSPMTGDVSLLPPLSGRDKPGHYACALLTGDDLPPGSAPPTRAASFFRVLIVYNRRATTGLRACSSDTNRWSREVASTSKIDDGRLRKLGQSIVLRGGVAFWPLRRTALAIRLDGPEPAEIPMPRTGVLSDAAQRFRLLGVTTDDRTGKQQLCFTDARFPVHDDLRRAGLPHKSLILATKVLHAADQDDDDDDMSNWEWKKQPDSIKLPEIKVRHWAAVNLRWFCERSGLIWFTVDEQDNTCSGAYVLDVATREVEKVVHGAGCELWRNLVGYEMDPADYLAYILPRIHTVSSREFEKNGKKSELRRKSRGIGFYAMT